MTAHTCSRPRIGSQFMKANSTPHTPHSHKFLYVFLFSSLIKISLYTLALFTRNVIVISLFSLVFFVRLFLYARVCLFEIYTCKYIYSY